MLSIVITALIAFFGSSLFGYVVHRSLHQKWTGFLNRKHMNHHLIQYPSTDYLSDTYRDAGKDNTVFIFAVAAVPLVAAPIILGVLGMLSLPCIIVAEVIMLAMGFLHDYIHDRFHIKNHWLNNIPVIKNIFGYWNHLHYLHHIDMQKNFGIFLFHWDVVFKTLYKA